MNVPRASIVSPNTGQVSFRFPLTLGRWAAGVGGVKLLKAPCLGEAGATLTMQRKEIQEGASPGASAPGWGDGLGGGGTRGA